MSELHAPETVEAEAFINHLLAIANLPSDTAIVREAVAACGLSDKTAYTGPEMQAIEAAIAQKVQYNLAVSNNPDIEGLKALMTSVHRLLDARAGAT